MASSAPSSIQGEAGVGLHALCPHDSHRQMFVDVFLWLEKSKTIDEKDRKGTGLFIRQQDSESWWALRAGYVGPS